MIKLVTAVVFLACLLSLLWFLLPSGFAQGPTKLMVDPRVTYQSIDSFGASDAWSINPIIKKWADESNEPAIEELADLLFSTQNGIGLSGWRFNIGAGSALQGDGSLIPDPLRRAELLVREPHGEIDESQQKGQIRMLREANERGVSDFVAFANSPPIWATKNGLTHPNTGEAVGSTNLNPSLRNAFAKSLVDVVAYLRSPKVGVPVNYVSPLNEPTWDWQGKTQEGCPYNIEDIKQVYKAVHSQIVDAGLADQVHVDGPEVVEYTAALNDVFKIAFDKKIYLGGMHSRKVGRYRNYIDEFLGDLEMRSILRNKISMHGYFSDAWPDRLGMLRDMTLLNVKSVSPEAKIWMSEFCILGDPGKARSFGGPGYDPDDMEFALHLAKVMHRDLVRLQVSAWHWWLAITPYDYKDGLLRIGQSLDRNSLRTTKAFWAFGNFSRFIRPGFVRVQISDPDDWGGLMVSAFTNPQDGTLVFVIVNGSRSKIPIDLELSHPQYRLLDETLQIFVTDKDHNLAEQKTTEDLMIAPQSITTIVGRFSSDGS